MISQNEYSSKCPEILKHFSYNISMRWIYKEETAFKLKSRYSTRLTQELLRQMLEFLFFVLIIALKNNKVASKGIFVKVMIYKTFWLPQEPAAVSILWKAARAILSVAHRRLISVKSKQSHWAQMK